ncbi:MAG: pepsin/retropepsin-like aspartic protease family protein [Saprospiraceae bacterium]
MALLKWVFLCAFSVLTVQAHCLEINFNFQKEAAEVLTIPFHLVKKLVVVKAIVDGKKGNFIIDTGAEAMILHDKYFVGQINTGQRAADFAGLSIAFKTRTVKFQWQDNKPITCSAVVTSLSALEQLLGADIMGYIGYDILKNYEVVFDYQSRNITLFELGKRGKRKSPEPLHTDASDTISLKPNGPLPYLTVQLGGQKLKMGIDSGASINLLQTRATKKLNDHFEANGVEATAGFNGEVTLSEQGYLRQLKIENTIWSSMKCVVSEMSELNRTVPTSLDGLLGFEFLKQYKVSINYQRNEMYVWPLESAKLEAITER